MTTHFTYNFVEKTIVGTKASINRANACKEPEYSELCAKMAEHPDFKVEIKVINTKKDKKTYSNLTIKKMEDYILLQNDTEKFKEFKTLQDLAKAMGAKYPICKKWFLSQYPEFKNSEDDNKTRDALLAEKTALLAKLDISEEELLEEEPLSEDIKDAA